MPTISCEISESLKHALAARSARTGEPHSQIVMSALADALEMDHSTLFQVSTSTALVQGVYDGVVRIGDLKQHGDFGLGTFDGLDVELLNPTLQLLNNKPGELPCRRPWQKILLTPSPK